LCATIAHADTILDPAAPYGLQVLSVAALPSTSYPAADTYYFQSLAFYQGKLLVAVDDPVAATQHIMEMAVIRDAFQHIVGFGQAETLATVVNTPVPIANPFNGGMLVDSAGNLIYSSGQVNPDPGVYNDYLGQVNISGQKSQLTQVVNSTLTGQGGISGMGNLVTNGSTATLTFVTDGVHSAADATWWTLLLSNRDANGFYTTISPVDTGVHLPANAFVYIPAGYGVANDSVLVEYNNQLVLYDINPSIPGTPLLGSGQNWLYGYDQFLAGMVRDPVTGDILVAEHPFGIDSGTQNRILLLTTSFHGATPEPAGAGLVFGGLTLLAAVARRKGLLNRHR
jgi:hypothetical protein